jgi:hypothetical protein
MLWGGGLPTGHIIVFHMRFLRQTYSCFAIFLTKIVHTRCFTLPDDQATFPII